MRVKAEKIVWDDAGEFGGLDVTWATKDEVLEMHENAVYKVESIGFVIHEDFNSIIIAPSYDSQYKQYAGFFRIPTGMIISREVVDES